MPATQVSIINGALANIAQKPIANITDLSPQAVTAIRAWDSALQASLREATPCFATAVIALAVVSTYTPIHWLYAYAYPANCLAMNLVYGEGTVDPTIGEEFRELYDHVNNQKVIVTNIESAYGEYTYLVSDTTLFDASFVKVMEYRLAADLAVPLVGDQKLAESMEKKFIVAASECDRYNSYEQNSSTKQTSSFVKAR